MADSWANVVEVVSLFSGVAGVLSFVVSLIVDVVSQHDRSRRSRRITGWFATALGLTTVGTLSVSLIESGPDVQWSPHAWLIAGIFASIVLTVAGIWRALTLPGDRANAPVYQILEALNEGTVGQAPPPNYQPLPAVEKHPRRRHLRTRTLMTWILKGRDGLVAVESPSGTGKSMEFQEVRRLLVEHAHRSRRVKLIPVYIDLSEILGAGLPLSTDVLRDHIKATVRTRNEYLAEELELLLRGAREDVSWVLFLDSFEQVDPAARSEAWAVLAELVRTANFRAVVAIKDPVEPPMTGRRLELISDSFRWRGAFLDSFALTPQVRDWLLQWTDSVTDLGRDQIGPYLLRLLAEHFEQTSTTPAEGTVYEVIEAIIERRLAEEHRSSDAVLFAEELAHARLAGLPRPADEPALTRALVDAGLLVTRHGQLADFPDTSLLTHFATRRLLRVPGEPVAEVLLTKVDWRLPLLGLLERCTATRRTELLLIATALLEQEADRYGNVVADVELDLLGPACLRPDARSGTFDWPPVARRLLLVLAEGLGTRRDVLPPALTAIADRFVVSAFVPYVLLDERADAIRMLSLCSDRVALWALEGSLNNLRPRGPRQVAAEQLMRLSGMFDQLGIVKRIVAMATALSDPNLLPRILRNGVYPGGTEQRAFSDVAVGVVRVLQVVAVYIAVTSPIQFVIEILGPSDLSVARPLWTLAAACFLLFTLTRGRMPHPVVAILSGATLTLGALLGALGGALTIGPALFLVITGNADDGFADVVSALIATWPVAMSHRIIDDIRRPTVLDWIFPHLHLVLSLPTVIPRRDYRGSITRNARALIVVILVIGGFIGLAEANLPRVEGPTEEDLRQQLLSGLVIGLIAVSVLWGYLRGLMQHQKTRATLATRPDNETFLRLLSGRRNQKETDRFLKAAESSSPGSLAPAYTALRDVSLALTHVDRCVQPDSKRPIKKAIWYMGEPEFATPKFREWIIEYDERYPGRLLWLAQRERVSGRLSKAAELNRPSRLEARATPPLHEEAAPQQ